MFFTIAILLIVLSMIFHEAGHWYEMRRCGIKVTEAGLGIPIFRKLQIRFKLKWWPNTVITLNPLLLGAYVKPEGEDKAFDNLPYKHTATICGAGPLANVIFFFVVSVVAGLVTPNVAYTNEHNLVIWGCFLLGVPVIFLARKYISFVLPVLGIASTVYIGYILAHRNIALSDSLTGPVGIVKIARKASHNLPWALNFAAMISLYIGQANSIPIFPTDGGRVVDALLKNQPGYRNVFRNVGLVLIFTLLLFATTNDFMKR